MILERMFKAKKITDVDYDLAVSSPVSEFREALSVR
jgi:hypothetical protein